MAIEGSLSDVSLADICQLLSLGRHTGCLSLTDRSNFGYIYLEKGRVTNATVLSRPDRLGDVLVKNGVVTREQLGQAMAIQAQGEGKRVGRILVEMGALSEEELTRWITVQVEEAVFLLFSWSQGLFHFDPGELFREDDGVRISLNMDGLLMEGARRVDEWSVLRKKISSLDLVFELERDPREEGPEVELTPLQQRMLPLLGEGRSVKEMVHDTGQVEFEVAKAVFGLIQGGFLREVGERRDPGGEGQSGGVEGRNHLRLGNAFLRAGMPEDAEREFRTAVTLDPGLSEARSRLALLHLKAGMPLEALRELEAMEGSHSLSLADLRHGALALEQLGRLDEALEAIGTAQEAYGAQPALLLARAIVELKSHRPRDAWVSLQEYRGRLGEGRVPAIYFSYGVLAAAMAGDMDRAVALGREGLREHEDHPALLVNLGAILVRRGDLEAGEALLHRAAATAGAPPQVFKNLGDLAYRRGEDAAARANYEKAIALEPHLGEDVFLKLGNIAYKDGDDDWALLLWKRGRELNPDHPELRESLARLDTGGE
jgi:tetratricopeptide (TPR) repeat protein